jgi:large subunit ribosomal protein L6
MVEGVTKGYEKRLEIHGVGFQAKIEKGTLNLQIGFSTPVLIAIPKGITVEAPNPTTLDVKGIDRQLVGEFSARIRATRKPEPYKGKGIRFAGEQIRRKAGKSMATGK